MPTLFYRTCRFIFLCGCLVALLTACNFLPSSNPTTHTTLTPSSVPTHPIPTTVPVPPTQTSCPANGTARALVTAPLVVGNHPTIVYSAVESDTNHVATMGMLKRYDVTTGQTTLIVQLPNMMIGSAQVSSDGQWVLFTASSGQYPAPFKVEAVRMDGQGLQTLYCSGANGTISGDAWSPDQKWIVFGVNPPQAANGQTVAQIQLLNVATGSLQTVFSFSTPYAVLTVYHSWLDATHFYLLKTGPDGYTGGIYLLDITKGANQQQNDLTTVLPERFPYKSFVNSYDHSHVYINNNGCGQVGCQPPSSIAVIPALGGTPQTLWQSTKYDVTQVCPVNSHQLLLSIYNGSAFDSVDTSNNGIWVMNTDGAGLTRLIVNTTQNAGSLSGCWHTWDNASRDGSMYALLVGNAQGTSGGLAFGKLDGNSSLTTFASLAKGLVVSMVGWTTM